VGRGRRARYGQASQVGGVRRGNVVAFGLHHPDLGREYVIVAAELRAPIDDAAAEMFAEDALGKSSGPASKLGL